MSVGENMVSGLRGMVVGAGLAELTISVRPGIFTHTTQNGAKIILGLGWG